MTQSLKVIQLDDFFQQAEAQAITFPREIMLGEGAILATLALGVAVFTVLALFRRSATALASASLAGVTLVLLASMFGYFNFLPAGSMVVVQAVFVATAILFLTVTVRVARENALLGAILLLAMIGVAALGIIGFVGTSDVTVPLRLSIGGLAFFAVVLTLHQGLGGDRRAMMVAPGALLAGSSLLAMIIGGNVGVNHWIGAITPHVMLAGGVLMSGLLAMLVPDAAPAEEAQGSAEPVFSAPPAVAMKEKGEAPELPASLTSDPAPAPETPAETPVVTEAEERIPLAATERPSIKAESPISALWGKKNTPARSEPGLAAAAPAATEPAHKWRWSATQPVEAGEAALKALGMPAASLLTPENIRNLIGHDDLAAYDDAILGGGEPASGPFDFTAGLLNGTAVRFRGARQVDEDGLISELTGEIVPETGDRKVPADMSNLAAQREAAAREAEIKQLKTALVKGEIRAHFQPIVRVHDEEVIGYEALARWHRPQSDEPLTPAEFINTAIEAGLEEEVISAVLGEAARELAAWVEAEPGKGQFVTFNVSADSMINDNLAKLVRDQIRHYNLPKDSLVVEMTESHITSNQAKALQVAKALRQAGARLALDDLGAGYASLDQLNKFKFDIVKTDKSLMTSATDSAEARTLLSGLIDLARKLGMVVVAEGIENEQAVAVLQQTGCDLAQGYHYGAPEPAGTPAEDDRSDVIASLR